MLEWWFAVMFSVGNVTVLCIAHYTFGQKWMSECPYCLCKVIHKGEQEYKDPRNPKSGLALATFDTLYKLIYCVDYNLKAYEHSSLKQPIANQTILRLIQLLKHSIFMETSYRPNVHCPFQFVLIYL